ncbi:hypothetical protein QYZ87_08850 [Porphyromonadaceae bacterium W3.11]|nr:hypothetical protein [Porphyromonadaceae bacterium W3.11]
MAAGIPSIDGVGGGFEGWQDPEFIMDKGLKDVEAARNLEQDFEQLLKLGLDIIDKKVFLLILDDIDVDFKKGWSVLETLRRYMTSPYIITILSGDFELFSKSIRKHQWNTFGKALLVNEGEKLEKMRLYNDLVTQMEDQYVQKVLQSRRRIHLNTIQEKTNIYGNKSLNIYVKGANQKENPESENSRIDKYINTKLELFGITNKYQQEPYRSFILNMPLRSIVQFLLSLEGERFNSLDFVDLFNSDVYNEEVDLDLAKSNDKFIVPIILKYLIKNNALDYAYQLQPTTTNRMFNSVLMALTLLFSSRCKESRFLIFEYFIKIGYVRNIFDTLLPIYGGPGRSLGWSRYFSIGELCDFSMLFNDRTFRDSTGLMIASVWALLLEKKWKKQPWGGNIPIHTLSVISNKVNKMDELSPIDILAKDLEHMKGQIILMPVSRSQHNNKREAITSFSFLMLLSSIAEIIRRSELEENLEFILNDLAHIKTYMMPDITSNFYEGNAYETDSIIIKSEKPSDQDSKKILSELINKWLQFSKTSEGGAK